jgi:hypothetical protein
LNAISKPPHYLPPQRDTIDVKTQLEKGIATAEDKLTQFLDNYEEYLWPINNTNNKNGPKCRG